MSRVLPAGKQSAKIPTVGRKFQGDSRMPNFSTETEFNKLLDGRCNIDLVGLMLELAADQYPNLDRVGCLLELDRLGVECGSQPALAGCGTVADRLAAISYVLYEVEGFHGNLDTYYDPRNSYLNEVLAAPHRHPHFAGHPLSVGGRAGRPAAVRRERTGALRSGLPERRRIAVCRSFLRRRRARPRGLPAAGRKGPGRKRRPP